MPYAELDEFSMFYSVCGSGEALLMLHGNGEDGRIFSHQIQAFSGFFTVYTLDSRWHGKSEKGGGGVLTYRQMAADVLEFMDRLGIQSAHLLGFSDGGNIALMMARLAPERMKSIVLLGANAAPNGLLARERLWMRCAYAAFSLCAWLPACRRKKHLYGLMLQGPHITREELAGIGVPSLVVAGEKDVVRPAHTRYIADTLQNASLCILKGCDHFALIKAPQVLNECVQLFYERAGFMNPAC
ncbi:MAG: alpha/beta fold hydrolase [Christensenellales bacterium]|jgi:pimeloyl-ACP methyl ester carboxylesterase